MLKTMTSFFSALVLSVVSLFALYTPSASAATLEWTGGGADLNFSTPENWSGGVAPVDGDDLVFDNDVFNFGDYESPSHPNNDLTAVSFNSITTQGTGTSNITLTGNDYVLTGGIDAAARLSIRGANVTLAANQTFSGPVSIFGDGEGDNYMGGLLNVAEHTLTTSNAVDVDSTSIVSVAELAGSGNLDVSAPVAIAFSSNGFTGGATVRSGADLRLAISQANSGINSLIVEDGASLNFCGNDFEYEGTLTIGGAGIASAFSPSAVNITSSCGAGGGPGASAEPADTSYTLSGVTSLTANTKIRATQNQTITFSDVQLNGYSLELTDDSSGTLVVNDNTTVREPETVTIEVGDDDPDVGTGVLAQDTLILNGTRGFVSVFGTLKGTGSAGYISINGGGTLAPGLSPGCIDTNTLDFAATGTYQVEIAGVQACDDYDQMQVSDTLSLGDAILDVSFLNEFVPAGGDEFVIILNEGEDPMTGTFDGLAEGAEVVVDGVTFTISYEGGDGNDVVLTVIDAPAAAPEAPDTGFALVMANPIVTLLVSIASAATLFMIARRQFSN